MDLIKSFENQDVFIFVNELTNSICQNLKEKSFWIKSLALSASKA